MTASATNPGSDISSVPDPPPPSWHSFSWVRLAGGLVVGGLLLALAAWLQPAPSRQEGATLCLPWIGSRVSIPASLPDSARARVAAHEAVHVAQCRELGSWRLFLTHLTVAGRLRLEAEAGCAEARLGQAAGRSPSGAFEELVDDLTYAVPRGASPGAALARAAAAAACPDVARRAAEDSSRRQPP